jgi:hypothetical protein
VKVIAFSSRASVLPLHPRYLLVSVQNAISVSVQALPRISRRHLPGPVLLSATLLGPSLPRTCDPGQVPLPISNGAQNKLEP